MTTNKISSRKIKRYGWLPDLPDKRDMLYSAPMRIAKALPPKVDLRKHCPPVQDQGSLGSCTANAIGAAFQFGQMKQGLPGFTPSRLFIYYNERVMENTVDSDSGAMIRDGIKSTNKQGVCPEQIWPYILTRFTKKPPTACYLQASRNQSMSYMRVVNTLQQMKACLADGFPFVFGFTVYESFESDTVARTGNMPMPNLKKEKTLGGHAVMAVGYDDTKKRFIIRNSWGTEWGQKGYFAMPYDFITDDSLCDDFWTIRMVEDGQ